MRNYSSAQSSVFPTHVGVFLLRLSDSALISCLPHARGGVSWSTHVGRCQKTSSPRTWGCFQSSWNVRPADMVFPTHVGVFLIFVYFLDMVEGLPHARGGVSSAAWIRLYSSLSSPRTWGCFWARTKQRTTKSVFPTHVGVFLK